jgi:hypothetical protein
VQIRKDQGVIDLRGHVSIVAEKCYEVINWELIEAPGVIYQ